MKIAENSFQNDIQTSAVNKRVVVSNVKLLHNTVPSHNKHTYNKHTFFVLTKMCLFGEEDFGKINSLYFFNDVSLETHFLLLLKNCVMQD